MRWAERLPTVIPEALQLMSPIMMVCTGDFSLWFLWRIYPSAPDKLAKDGASILHNHDYLFLPGRKMAWIVSLRGIVKHKQLRTNFGCNNSPQARNRHGLQNKSLLNTKITGNQPGKSAVFGWPPFNVSAGSNIYSLCLCLSNLWHQKTPFNFSVQESCKSLQTYQSALR